MIVRRYRINAIIGIHDCT